MPSPSHSYIRLSVIAAMSAAVFALSGCSQEEAETREVVRPVKVVEIAAIDTSRTLSYSGTVRARTEMNLGFRVNGKITERRVDIGQRVKSGDLLARIDPTDYALALTSAQANLDATERAG